MRLVSWPLELAYATTHIYRPIILFHIDTEYLPCTPYHDKSSLQYAYYCWHTIIFPFGRFWRHEHVRLPILMKTIHNHNTHTHTHRNAGSCQRGYTNHCLVRVMWCVSAQCFLSKKKKNENRKTNICVSYWFSYFVIDNYVRWWMRDALPSTMVLETLYNIYATQMWVMNNASDSERLWLLIFIPSKCPFPGYSIFIDLIRFIVQLNAVENRTRLIWIVCLCACAACEKYNRL